MLGNLEFIFIFMVFFYVSVVAVGNFFPAVRFWYFSGTRIWRVVNLCLCLAMPVLVFYASLAGDKTLALLSLEEIGLAKLSIFIVLYLFSLTAFGALPGVVLSLLSGFLAVKFGPTSSLCLPLALVSVSAVGLSFSTHQYWWLSKKSRIFSRSMNQWSFIGFMLSLITLYIYTLFNPQVLMAWFDQYTSFSLNNQWIMIGLVGVLSCFILSLSKRWILICLPLTILPTLIVAVAWAPSFIAFAVGLIFVMFSALVTFSERRRST